MHFYRRIPMKAKPILVLAVLFVFSAPAMAEISSFPVVVNTNGKANPVTNGNVVVYGEVKTNWQLYAYNLADSTGALVSENAGNERISIYDDTLVYCKQNRVYGYNLYGGTEYRISAEEYSQYSPRVGGEIVDWVDGRNGNWDIYSLDITSGIESAVSVDFSTQTNPDTNGKVVVWYDDRNGNWDIYSYDASTGVELQICGDSAMQISPVISGDIVVWRDSRNGDYEIRGYNLADGEEFSISGTTADWHPHAIDGNIVVWTDTRNGNDDIYGYDLLSGTEFPICTAAGNQMNPDISGNLVVWEDYRNGVGDIYGAIVPEPSTWTLLTIGVLAVLVIFIVRDQMLHSRRKR